LLHGKLFQQFDALESFPHFLRRDTIVVTSQMRASTGMRFKAKLQPIQPARRAVTDSGFRLIMADGGKAKCKNGFDARPHPGLNPCDGE
jgi:hypothetical protein